MKKIIVTIFISFFTLCSFSQGIKRKNYLPIWTFHQDSINIQGVSVGLWSVNSKPRFTNTNGIKLELIGIGIIMPLIPSSPIVENDSSFKILQLKPLSERINGLSLSASGTICHCLTNGISAGFIGQINFQVNGISSSLLMNFSQKHNGIMTSMFNESYFLNGVQIGLLNYNYKTKGIQIGILSNGSKEIKGLQIGLYNKSENLKGVQIGLWNVNQKRKLPFFNWNFK